MIAQILQLHVGKASVGHAAVCGSGGGGGVVVGSSKKVG
jgi:hypothetical protein